MSTSAAIIITLIAIMLSAFFSGMEIAFVSSNRVRASIDANKRGLINRILNVFYSHTDMVISTLLVGNNVVLVVYSMAFAMLFEPVIQLFTDNDAVVLLSQTIISTVVILIAGEFIPKMAFRTNPNTSMRHGSPLLLIFYFLLYPVSWFASLVSSTCMRLVGVKAEAKQSKGLTIGELDAYLQESIDRNEDENNQIENEVKIFQNALDFSSTHLRDCMVPRNEIVAVPIDKATNERLVRLFCETGLSKIIVYRDDIDDVVGYIHVSELFHKDTDWKQHIKSVLFAPETMLANKMMRSLMNKKKSVAVVVDEFGGTAGMVTLEDLVEEIFGDIEDEHDRKRIMARKVADGVYDFAGRAEIDYINDQYHLDIPEDEEYQTLAGYILYNLEEIPETGQTFTIDGMLFTIVKKSANKLETIRVDTNAATADKPE